MFVPAEKSKLNFKGYTLIYPAVSVGNVAQLMADLLISTLTLHRAGYIQHPMYESVEHNFVIVQQRAPFVRDLERRQSFPAPPVTDSGDKEEGQLYIPGGGIAKRLFEDLSPTCPVAVLLMFCSEGDNVAEAIDLTNRINRWLGLVLFHSRSIGNAFEEAVVKYTQWKIPSSWKLFFGSRVDQSLFH
ncbi:PSMG2-like protein [Mya arenaria]|uniref:PSMG2-like protein n=1 Tax=Mya arenaria TaxID=6604 RepID=A0ABY7E5Y0_MYAAR|nr:PSMG2-like protein [Mya arenaria]